jgi:hypothetical protein
MSRRHNPCRRRAAVERPAAMTPTRRKGLERGKFGVHAPARNRKIFLISQQSAQSSGHARHGRQRADISQWAAAREPLGKNLMGTDLLAVRIDLDRRRADRYRAHTGVRSVRTTVAATPATASNGRTKYSPRRRRRACAFSYPGIWTDLRRPRSNTTTAPVAVALSAYWSS